VFIISHLFARKIEETINIIENISNWLRVYTGQCNAIDQNTNACFDTKVQIMRITNNAHSYMRKSYHVINNLI